MVATIGNFRTACGCIKNDIAGFALPGNNAGFCNSILNKSVGSAPLRLGSLTYVLPSGESIENTGAVQQQVVVNLLLQLRAFFDQNNGFIQNRFSMEEQVSRQLRYVLSQVDHGTRVQAEGIEHSIRKKLYQDGEFRKAVSHLESTLKKK